MPHTRIPQGRAWGRGWRRVATVLNALSAFMGMALVAGPFTAAAVTPSCALPRSDVHHSLGTDTWNTDFPRPDEPLDAAMLFLSFPDSRPFTSPAKLAKDHFPATSDFFSRASYGRFDLRPHPTKRWLEMPSPSTGYGIQRDWDPEARTTFLNDAIDAADPHIDFSRYDIVYLVADPDAPGVNADATKVVNFDEPVDVDGDVLHRLVTVFEQSPPDRNVLAHETGHAFDLPDLYRRPDEGVGDWDTHVGDWDLMGSQFGLAPDLFAWQKWKVGWLERQNIVCLPARDGAAKVALRPLGSRPLGSAEDNRLAVIRTGLDEALAVEVRGSRGSDRGLCRSGVLLYWVHSDRGSTEGPVEVVDGHPGTQSCADASVYPALADAPLRAGEDFVTERGGGVRVEVERRVADGGYEVNIRRG